MAGAGQPFYAPILWPFAHLAKISSITKETPLPPKPKGTPDLDLIGHLTSTMASVRSFGMAYFCICMLYDNNSVNPEDASLKYPGFRDNINISLDWMFVILLRNMIATGLICGVWDYILYFSPICDKISNYKFNPEYPCLAQLKHDIFYTFLSSFCGGMIEIILCYGWSNGYINYQMNMFDTPLINLVWIITITHWRNPHFWLIHRMMHPWKSDILGNLGMPDMGAILYKYVHSLHHKSYNPTAFSGTNMHPIESTLYYSACLIAVAFGCHPSIVLGCMVDCAVGAWLGHDGFQWPGSGDYFHQLHHMHFDCNYGAMHVPIDKWLGTFISTKDDLRKVWKNKAKTAGKKANEQICQVHSGRVVEKKKA